MLVQASCTEVLCKELVRTPGARAGPGGSREAANLVPAHFSAQICCSRRQQAAALSWPQAPWTDPGRPDPNPNPIQNVACTALVRGLYGPNMVPGRIQPVRLGPILSGMRNSYGQLTLKLMTFQGS